MFGDETGDALWRAILDHPGDDDRRLVLCDWLEETGRDAKLAAFVREQTLVKDPLLAGMFREQVLRSMHPSGGTCRAAWSRKLREACAVKSFKQYGKKTDWFAFSRGLVGRASVPLLLWLPKWREIRRLAPLEEIAVYIRSRREAWLLKDSSRVLVESFRGIAGVLGRRAIVRGPDFAMRVDQEVFLRAGVERYAGRYRAYRGADPLV
jgi:uncharacterized protein (TIGR02996 family)